MHGLVLTRWLKVTTVAIFCSIGIMMCCVSLFPGTTEVKRGLPADNLDDWLLHWRSLLSTASPTSILREFFQLAGQVLQLDGLGFEL
jgi:hypothetical protein